MSGLFHAMWIILVASLYISICNGGGELKLIPKRIENSPFNINETWRELTLNGTDRFTVSFGYEHLPYKRSRSGSVTLLPKNFNVTKIFYSIMRVFFIFASINVKNKKRNVVTFTYAVDFMRDGKTKNIKMKNKNTTLEIRYQMTCDEYSKGVLCDLCRAEVSNPRYYCVHGKRVCKTGFSNPRMDCTDKVRRNFCDPDPCLNGGKCIDLPKKNDYRCKCGAEFQGKNCSEEVDQCKKYSPCKNGGTCIVELWGFKCQCKVGFRGKYCDLKSDVCLDKAPCWNGATCHSSGSKGYKCHCASGFAGENCKDDVNECLKKPCKNGGKCVNLFGDYKCFCRTPHYGKNCAKTNPLCLTDSPCKNGGKCTLMTLGYNCRCAPGFRGKRCTEDSDECKIFHPCLNQGVCYNTYGSFKCICPDKYFGKLCQYRESDCLVKNCLNQGSCDEIDGQFFCKCKRGYFGEFCGEKFDYCKNNKQCQNNGKCKTVGEGFVCECLHKNVGKYCQLDAQNKNETTDQTQQTDTWPAASTAILIILCVLTLLITLGMIFVVFECWSKEDEDIAMRELAEIKERKHRLRRELYCNTTVDTRDNIFFKTEKTR